MWKVIQGDCLEVLKTMEDDSIDALVTDPPAGISFMGKSWDSNKGGRDQWIAWLSDVMGECLRVLKPGAHGLVWALPRTSHWTATALEDAGFEIRDRIAFIFGSGFPKSHDVSKAIDRMAGAEREVVSVSPNDRPLSQVKNGMAFDRALDCGQQHQQIILTTPATDAAREWDGWHSALKPSVEDWWLCRKPLSERTIAANVLRWGTGALNIDGCRVPIAESDLVDDNGERTNTACHEGYQRPGASMFCNGKPLVRNGPSNSQGRWPSHLIHDGSDEVVGMFPQVSSGGYPPSGSHRPRGVTYGEPNMRGEQRFTASAGSAARFFYGAKASKSDRNEGLPEGMENRHPTVKSTALMRYLCRLITPPGGIILDPFMGSGSTGKAAVLEGFSFVGIELNKQDCEVAEARIAYAESETLKNGAQLQLL